MLEQLISLDQQLFTWLNGFHAGWLDPLMLWITGSKSWIPFYLILGVIIARKYKWQTLYIVVAVALVITAADQFTSSFMKPFFGRLRPCYEPVLEGLVHIVKNCGGQYGFASSHAANTFGLAAFMWYSVGKKEFRWFRCLFLWAALVSYSRIYVGVHYPGDIIAGGLIGFLFGYLIARLYRFLEQKYIQKASTPSIKIEAEA